MYDITLASPTVLDIDTCFSNSFDTKLHVFVYDNVDQLSTSVGSCDDCTGFQCPDPNPTFDCSTCEVQNIGFAGNGFQSAMRVVVPPGRYMIVVEGFSSTEGGYTMRVACSAPPSNEKVHPLKVLAESEITDDMVEYVMVDGRTTKQLKEGI